MDWRLRIPVAMLLAVVSTIAVARPPLVAGPGPQAQREMQKAVLARVFREYCAWDKRLTAVYLKAEGSPHYVSASVVAAVNKNSRIRVAPFSSYKPNESDKSSYGGVPENLMVDRRTGKRAALLSIGNGAWTSSSGGELWVSYQRSQSFHVSMRCLVTRSNGRWQAKIKGIDTLNRVVVRGRVNGHRFRVERVQRPLDLRRHRITGNGISLYVDGKMAIGTDGGTPSDEITAFNVSVDGVRWNFPKRLWRDCFQPNQDPIIWMSKDGTRMRITMQASDGAGGYIAIWRLNKDGRVWRKLDSEC